MRRASLGSVGRQGGRPEAGSVRYVVAGPVGHRHGVVGVVPVVQPRHGLVQAQPALQPGG